jgi:hypothetical protein
MPSGDAVRHVAFLVAASANAAFFSQAAVLRRVLDRLPWTRWRYSLHVYVGGTPEPGTLETWQPHLSGVDLRWSSGQDVARAGEWAQSDDVFRRAPEDADVLVALDADTLPVRSLEGILDEVEAAQAVAGTLAHYPTVVPDDDGVARRPSVRETWARLASGVVDVPLDFAFSHSLMAADAPQAWREAPFYLNFGVVFLPRRQFDRIAPEYLRIRPLLEVRMANPDFSGQAALTLAVAATGAATRELPLRYNFPNDPEAVRLHPGELDRVVIHHYLRTDVYDRHRIFRSAGAYQAFLAQPLDGVHQRFQADVRRLVGAEYPFA